MCAQSASLQTFSLDDLQQYTKEGVYANNASKDFHLFYVGRDDVHGILQHLLSRIATSLYLNMFGYDDDDLNGECMRCAGDPTITTVITLDESQSGSVHEKQILGSDVAKDPAAFNTHFVIGTSATGQISHTKGGVLDGRVGFEGSTNWSTSGEGTFVVSGHAGGAGYKAQNNTLAVFTDPDTIARFTAELIAEHLAASDHGKVLSAGRGPSAAAAKTPVPAKAASPAKAAAPAKLASLVKARSPAKAASAKKKKKK
jgi:hypothetical protein